VAVGLPRAVGMRGVGIGDASGNVEFLLGRRRGPLEWRFDVPYWTSLSTVNNTRIVKSAPNCCWLRVQWCEYLLSGWAILDGERALRYGDGLRSMGGKPPLVIHG